jgi:hypothetical protein
VGESGRPQTLRRRGHEPPRLGPVAEAPNRSLNAWLHISARGGAVTVLPGGTPLRGIDGQPQAVGAEGVYQHAARNGVDLGELLVTWQPAGPRGTAWTPFLHQITKI